MLSRTQKYTIIATLVFSLPCHFVKAKDFKPSDKITIPACKYPASTLLSPHKPVYFMPWHHNRDAGTSSYFKKFAENRSKESLEFNPNREVAFQWSGKMLLATRKKASLYAAYNQESHWQLYTIDPYFRSIDHQIEFFLEHPLTINEKTFYLRGGHVHRSNGFGLNISKTDWDSEKGWDRFYASLKYDFKKSSLLLKIWHIIIIKEGVFRIPDIGKYNPDIGDFLGYGKLTFMHRFSKNHSLMISKHLLDKSSNYGLSLKSTWEVSYLYPILPAIQVIFKGFSGYGKNMITYNSHTLGAGVGFALCFD